jgi:CcmD family protein
MVYLFWAFALVWLGLFAYLYRLQQRGRALERQVLELLERAGAGMDVHGTHDGLPTAPAEGVLAGRGAADRAGAGAPDGQAPPAHKAAGAGDA